MFVSLKKMGKLTYLKVPSSSAAQPSLSGSFLTGDTFCLASNDPVAAVSVSFFVARGESRLLLNGHLTSTSKQLVAVHLLALVLVIDGLTTDQSVPPLLPLSH